MRRYLHVLAERLGRTVAELAAGLTAAELRDWIAFDRLAAPQEPGAVDLETMRRAFCPVRAAK